MEETNLKTSYDRDGFAVVRQFLPQDEFAELQSELSRYIRLVVPTLPDTAAFYENRSRPETLKQLNHMSFDPYFNDYVQNPRWVNLATELIGEPAVAISATEWFNKPAGTNHPTPPHQDNYYFNLTPAHVLTLWLALEDVDEENGCLRYLPGSHRQGRLLHQASSVLGFSQGLTEYGEQERASEVPVPLKANDLLIHHGWTVHRADPNRSLVRNRPSFAIAFRGVSCGVDEAASQAYHDSLQKQHDAFGVKSQSVS